MFVCGFVVLQRHWGEGQECLDYIWTQYADVSARDLSTSVGLFMCTVRSAFKHVRKHCLLTKLCVMNEPPVCTEVMNQTHKQLSELLLVPNILGELVTDAVPVKSFLCRKDTLRIMANFVFFKPSLVSFLDVFIICFAWKTQRKSSCRTKITAHSETWL